MVLGTKNVGIMARKLAFFIFLGPTYEPGGMENWALNKHRQAAGI